MSEHTRHGTVVHDVGKGVFVVETESPAEQVRVYSDTTVHVGDRVEVQFRHHPNAGDWHVARVMPDRPFGKDPVEVPVKWTDYVDEE